LSAACATADIGRDAPTGANPDERCEEKSMSTTIAWATRTDRILDLMAGAETNGIGVREATR